MNTSTNFEHRVRRIHDLIEESGATVTWNDKTPDPDNPNQVRQIDITLRNGDQLTLVECRIHNRPQDVMWIEELIGRRMSLRAQGVIAVSNSGFTEGAIIKAKKFGIILRDFISLTEGEISSWGKSTQVKLGFFEFKKVRITFLLTAHAVGSSFLTEVFQAFQNGGIDLFALFNLVANKIEIKDIKDKSASLKADLGLKEKVVIDGIEVKNLVFEADVEFIEKTVDVPSVCIYGAPGVQASDRNIAVEEVDLGNFEITQAGDEVMVALDLSTVEGPPNCLFSTVSLDFGRTVHITRTEIVGLPKQQMALGAISIGIRM